MTPLPQPWAAIRIEKYLREVRDTNGVIDREVMKARMPAGEICLLRCVREASAQWLPHEKAGMAVQKQITAHVPGLVPWVLGEISADGYWWVCQEWIEGQDVASYVAARSLHLTQVALLGSKICRAIEHWESLGFVHHDLKPEHIFVRADQSIVVLDWGSATSRGVPAHQVPVTPLYCPEEGPGPGSDTWAAAATIFKLMAGWPPYAEAAPGQVMYAHGIQFPHGWPRPLISVFAKALARQPAARYASTGEFRLALEAAFGFHGQPTRPAAVANAAPQPKVISRRAGVAVLVLFLSVLGFQVGAAVARAAKPAPHSAAAKKKGGKHKPKKNSGKKTPAADVPQTRG